MNEDQHKDLTGALKALESNNQIIPPEEKEKRDAFASTQAAHTSASLIRPLRTFESDAAEFIKQEQQSVYSIQKAEKEKHPERVTHSDPEKLEGRRNALLLFLSAMLFLAGCSFALYFFLLKDLITPPASVEQTASDTFIEYQVHTEVTYDSHVDTSLAEALRRAFNEKQNGLEEIEYITVKEGNETVSIDKVLASISTSIPGSFLRSLNKSDYMIGSIQKESKHPFIIARVDVYDNAFDGMLQWEKAIGGIFEQMTGTQNPAQAESEFFDALIRNKDVRILRNSDGSARVIYSFYDKKTLIITTNEDTFTTVVNALRAAQVIQ